ncbi:MAG TPA: chemotaxis protein CheW [Elusimicrobiota bacterium]|nr:chemotaxis protein CheW [Elusimicrobiota bacterium]
MDATLTEKKEGGKLLQLVSFKLGKGEFGIDILMVQEINRMLDITRVPKSPDFIDGVINLRGRVIPILNLRKRFGLPEKEHDKSTRIVVVNVNNKILGMIVDAVSEVLRLPSSTVEPPPPMVSGIESEYIKGVGKIDEKLLILLDLNKLLTSKEQQMLEHVAK